MTKSESYTIDSLFSVGQIRLTQLSVYNWGSFHGLHTAQFDEVGTLITGDNGSGKSTLIDGLMALLLPAGKASFNVAAAQGDRSDRSLLSYMRGSFGSAHDGSSTRVRSKRDGAVVTGLHALYRGDDGSQISLAALFWITQGSNSLTDVKRLYIVAKQALPLNTLLDNFGKGDIRHLKSELKKNPLVSYCESNFTEYQEVYRRLLMMENKNAPALLSRALGLKKIDDLTHLIRELVLEPSGVKADARKVVEEFTDLVAIHDQLTDARARQQTLARLPEIEAVLKQAESDIQSLVAERDYLRTYIAIQCKELWSARVKLINDTLSAINIDIKEIEEKIKLAIASVEQCHEAYIQAGGNRVEQVKKDLQVALDELTRVSTEASRYQTLSTELGLNPELDPHRFAQNQTLALDTISELDEQRKSVQFLFADQHMLFKNKDDEKKALAETIKTIEARPNSNIQPDYQLMRDTMVKELGLSEEDFPFIGELIDVQTEQLDWQGAIERALGGLRTTLLLPKAQYHLITRWLNNTHTGLHVRIQVADNAMRKTKNQATFKTDGYLRKLSWKEHNYRDWLKHHLSRFDLHCVDSVDTLNKTPFSITQQGLMQKEQGRFEKIDIQRVDDRRRWQLGFSNTSRLALLKQDEVRINREFLELVAKVKQAQNAMNELEERAKKWQSLSQYQWQKINLPHWKQQTDSLKETLFQLEHSNQDLATAKQYWIEAKQKEALIRESYKEISERRAVQEAAGKSALKQQNDYEQLASTVLEESTFELLAKRVGRIKDAQLESVATIENDIRQRITSLHDRANGRKHRATNEATGIMVSFRNNWSVIAIEWSAALNSLPDYLQHLQELEGEGLPALVEQFKERLNRHTTQSIASIKSRMDAEKEDISERIDTINQVLKRTAFKPGSHLKLGIKPEQFPHVKEFNQKIALVLSQASSDEHELRFASLQDVVEILDRASNSATANTMESLRLLDPRHQLAFHAEEIDSQNSEVLDVLESSSGKSGGEKEAFAGTIVAASLAYVLTPDGYDRPSYSTVFLDEAFSNTAESVSRRVLKVFRELHIHINLITPYKNLNLARESARSLIIAERDSTTHESALCEVTWDEIDRRREEQQQRLTQEAATLGVIVNE